MGVGEGWNAVKAARAADVSTLQTSESIYKAFMLSSSTIKTSFEVIQKQWQKYAPAIRIHILVAKRVAKT